MPSGERPDRLAWLRSQGLGLACGFATVGLLAIGSIVLAATRDGASAGIAMDDLRGFFAPPRLAHAWLYLLFPVAALYAVNTVLATWDTVVRRWRAGVRAPSAYAGSVVHLSFLLALASHAAGGFLGGERGEVLVASGWQEVPGFGEARLLSLDVDPLPNGVPREVRARLELRDGGGRHSEAEVGYNSPLASGAGARLALLSDLGRAWVARLASSDGGCTIAVGQGCRVAGEPLRLVGLAPGPAGTLSAIVRARGLSGTDEVRALAPGAEATLAGGGAVRLVEISAEPAVVLRAREAPGHPWALGASVTLAIGAALLWRRLVR